MDTISDVNQKIIKLWEEKFGEPENPREGVLIPLLYTPRMVEQERALLFLGSNPSFVPDAYRVVLDKRHDKTPPETFLSWANYRKGNLEEYLSVEIIVRHEYRRYFKAFEDISEKVGLKRDNWNHIDLFFFRETRQNEFKPMVYTAKDKSLTLFGQDQLNQSERLINYAQPNLVVVANAFAADVFLKKYDLENKFDERRGWYVSQFGGRDVPIFLSSMITGGHLDTHSRKRLIWHIKEALKEFGVTRTDERIDKTLDAPSTSKVTDGELPKGSGWMEKGIRVDEERVKKVEKEDLWQ